YSTWNCSFSTLGRSWLIVRNRCCPMLSAGLCFGKCWFSSLPLRSRMSTPGGRGCSDGAEVSRECVRDPARYPGQLGAQEQPLADALCHGVLRDRVDGRGSLAP